LAYRGAQGLSVGAGGELLIQTSLGILKDTAPVSYQLIGGERVPVEGGRVREQAANQLSRALSIGARAR
jgi:hypothetical protein